jgi:hypothetical protein
VIIVQDVVTVNVELVIVSVTPESQVEPVALVADQLVDDKLLAEPLVLVVPVAVLELLLQVYVIAVLVVPNVFIKVSLDRVKMLPVFPRDVEPTAPGVFSKEVLPVAIELLKPPVMYVWPVESVSDDPVIPVTAVEIVVPI